MSKRRAKVIEGIEIHEGSGNVYADLGYPDAELAASSLWSSPRFTRRSPRTTDRARDDNMFVGSTVRITRQLALTTAQQRRLERLAREAGRTTKAMLQFVLRDGFEACEEDVRENLAADAEFASGKSFTHKEAMRRVRLP